MELHQVAIKEDACFKFSLVMFVPFYRLIHIAAIKTMLP